MEPTVPTPASVPQAAPPPEAQPTKQISYDEFRAVEIRVGAVLTAERIPKADKLVKLSVDFGSSETRTVIAGIGKSFPDLSVLVNGRFAFVTNLAPRKMMGIESQAMLMAAPVDGDPDRVALVQVNGAEIGSRLS